MMDFMTIASVCDNLHALATQKGYTEGYARELGIGMGEMTYDKVSEEDFILLDIVFRSGVRCQCIYEEFDDCSFFVQEAGLGSWMYRVNRAEFEERFRKELDNN